jgi:general secretion pathway protein J
VRARGFTLVEVLVALLIMAVLATMAWQGIDSIARSREIAQGHLERTLRLNAVLGQWEQDLQRLYDSPSVPALAFDGASARIVREASGGVQLVAWSLRGDRWMRWTSPAVTRVADLQEYWLRSQQLLGNEPAQVLALTGVGDWQLFFFRGNAWSNAQSSGDVAPPQEGASAPARVQLPTGVRLVMTLPEGRVTRDVLLSPRLP